MIVVVILGVLAAVAVPAFTRYLRRSKTSEASDKLSLIYRGSVSYLINSNINVDRGVGGEGIALMFPSSTGPTPAASCCTEPGEMCLTTTADWEDPTWVGLDFSIADPHRFQYTYQSGGQGPGAIFTARANADLDCDGEFSTFERTGIISPSLDVQSARGIYRESPLE